VVRFFPARIGDWPLANLDNAIASRESHGDSRLNQRHMGPLKAVPVDIVGDLAKQNPFPAQDAIRLLRKRRIEMAEVVTLFERRFQNQAEARVEIFGTVAPLVGNVRRIVDDRVKAAALKRHAHIVADDSGPVPGIDVQADDLPFAPFPETTGIDGGIED